LWEKQHKILKAFEQIYELLNRKINIFVFEEV